MNHPSNCRFNHQLTSPAFAYCPSPALNRTHSPSIRDFRHHPEFSPHSVHSQWKHNYFDNDEPISPFHPSFSGTSSNTSIPYSPTSENPYGPSPPGTATSTSSSVPPLTSARPMPCSPSLSITHHLQRSLSTPNMAPDAPDTRTYAFVALPGNAVKKRPRRRYDEIERLYQCSWPECTKAYGTLNHLNAHVSMQKHGPKRTPDEFKEMRKQWRKAKKEQHAVAVTTPGFIRRDSFGEVYDEPAAYNHHYVAQHSSHSLHQIPRSHTFQDELGLPTSVNIAGDRYNVPIDNIRYPPSNGPEHDSPELAYSNAIMSRCRYSTGLSASWHGSSSLSRSNSVYHDDRYEPSSVPHHSHLPQLTIGGTLPRPSSPPPHSAPAHTHHYHSTVTVHRGGGGSPECSTLLTTPLSGYHQPSTLLSPVQNGSGPAHVIYSSEGYELYDSDSTGRPGTGHTNTSVS